MSCPTANEVASIRINTPTCWNQMHGDVRVVERYMKWFATPIPQLSNSKPENSIYSLAPLDPAWLSETLKSISKSTIPTDKVPENDGRWLNNEVVDAASDFFRRTSDLLPCEPVIYSSREGDLVSEFNTDQGALTVIVSPTFVVLFAVVNGEPIERRVTQASEMRGIVEELTELLRTGQYGSVDT